MSDSAMDALCVMTGAAILFCSIIWSISPSQMKQCIMLGYDWRGGDCVKGVSDE